MTAIAHRKPGPDGTRIDHDLREHLTEVARLAREFAGDFAPDWAYLAGLWHDLGKYSREFQSYIRQASADQALNAHVEDSGKGASLARVNHSSAGAIHARCTMGQKGLPLAYVIAGHHAGLADYENPSRAALRHRLKDESIPDWHAFAEEDLLTFEKPATPAPLHPQRKFSHGFFVRMLFSALVDADFLDTERFFDEERAVARETWPGLGSLRDRLDARIAARRKRNLKNSSEIAGIREQILENCQAAAAWEPGFFSLTVPTGGGKTISSLAFALDHALAHGKHRIVYAIPFTSIIEQNAKVFRDEVGSDAVLEHHSNLDPDKAKEDYRSRLACENWDAPLIATTNVMFFESLFKAKTSACRKLHNLAQSVIVLDEVQTLPLGYLSPCLEVLRELVEGYGATVVLCTATQPAFNKEQGFAGGLEKVREIMRGPTPSELQKRMERVVYHNLTAEPLSREALAARLRAEPSVLCIVNTKRQARETFEELGGDAWYLSTNLCPAHRQSVFAKIRDQLETGSGCRVVSTQLVEAGVDLDFPCVYRALAGLDSVVQAAGRCNRENKLSEGRVYVFKPEGGQGHPAFKTHAQIAERLLAGGTTLDLALIRRYFEELYWSKKFVFDAKNIVESLTEGASALEFPFRTVAAKFQFIEEDQMPVIVPFDEEAKGLIRSLRQSENTRGWLRRLQPYTVQVRRRDWEELERGGALDAVHDQYPVLVRDALYDKEKLGLCLDLLGTYTPDEMVF